eukprot:1644148-Pleurochrysis_carterae.AAC.1
MHARARMIAASVRASAWRNDRGAPAARLGQTIVHVDWRLHVLWDLDGEVAWVQVGSAVRARRVAVADAAAAVVHCRDVVSALNLHNLHERTRTRGRAGLWA